MRLENNKNGKKNESENVIIYKSGYYAQIAVTTDLQKSHFVIRQKSKNSEITVQNMMNPIVAHVTYFSLSCELIVVILKTRNKKHETKNKKHETK